MNIVYTIIKKLDKVITIGKSNENKLKTLHKENKELYRMLSDFMKLGIKSQVPYMTPKQLTIMYNRGVTLNELSAISGYNKKDIKKKISSYKNI